MNSKNTAKQEDAPKEPPVHALAEKGTVADTRRSPLAAGSRASAVPSDYRLLEQGAIQGLSKIADTQKAELKHAVQQAIERGPTLREEFGKRAPDTSALADLWARYQDAAQRQASALREAAYYGDIAQVAVHDMLQVLGLVDDTVRSTAERDSQVADDFSAVLKIADQRGELIRDGRARARADKKAALPDGEPSDGQGHDKKPVG